MNLGFERFAPGELDGGVFLQALGSTKTDVAVYSASLYGGLIREQDGMFSIIPPAPESFYGTTYGVASPDKVFSLGLTKDDAEETVGVIHEWNGTSWDVVVDDWANPDGGETVILIGSRYIASHDGVVYFMRVSDHTSGMSQHYRFKIYSWNGDSLELVDDITELTEDSTTVSVFLYIRNGMMYVTSLAIRQAIDEAVSSVKVWRAVPGNTLTETYYHEWPNTTFGSGAYTYVLHPIGGTTLWEAILPYNFGSDYTLKIYMDPDNGVQREATGGELTVSNAIPFAGGWIGMGSLDGYDGLFWRQSWSPATEWERIEGASSIPNGPFDYSVDTPLFPVETTDPTMLYAGGVRVDDEVPSLWNFRLIGEEEPGAIILRRGPVSRIMNFHTAVISERLANLRDMATEEESGSLILDSNGYRMVGLALSAEETAIKLREE